MKRMFIACVLSVVACAASADNYKIDSSHTFPTFEVRHLGLSVFRGRFDKTSGTVTLDTAKKTGSADVIIDTKSVSTGVEKLDEHLRKADFLDVEKYPQMTFKSNRFDFKGDKLVSVDGDLTLHGVTKPVTLKVNVLSCQEHPMTKKPACGGDLETTIKRSDFGVAYGIPAVSDEVTIRIGIEAGKVD